jgi:cobyrinic acid a,c-diamide synthase
MIWIFQDHPSEYLCENPSDELLAGYMAKATSVPRLVVAGLAGDSGKTLISVGLLLAAREAGMPVRAFKKGPDYIDAAWLTWASRHPARNLDTYLMGFQRAASSFLWHAVPGGFNLVEGNRGLYDGSDARGTHSTAELAKTLQAPVVLVLNATKVTRTAAAYVLGCQRLDPEVRIAAVVLNRVAGPRHESVLREAIESACGIPVLGALPKVPTDTLLPGRHLGLVTPEEHPHLSELTHNLLELIGDRLDLDRLLSLSRQASLSEQAMAPPPGAQAELPDGGGLKIAYLRDSAFTFYYPENLEVLEAAGATLAPISALTATTLPQHLDALYIGGGFPETHGASLSANRSLLGAIGAAARNGLPIYAECGGLMLLSRAIHWEGRSYAMAGVLPFEVEVCSVPQGHGYARLTVDRPNPFFPPGLSLRGHEFHYSKILGKGDVPPTACAVERGTGCYEGRDGVVVGNVWASYTHLHALAAPEWAKGLVSAARRFAR